MGGTHGVWLVRRAGREDIGTMCHCRREMFADMGVEGEAVLDEVAERFERYVDSLLDDAGYLGWVVEADDRVVGCIGALLQQMPPSPRNTSGRVGYLLNLYVEPEWRRLGMGSALVRQAVDFLAEQDVKIIALHSSADGRRIYEALGFEPTSEMRLLLP